MFYPKRRAGRHGLIVVAPSVDVVLLAFQQNFSSAGLNDPKFERSLAIFGPGVLQVFAMVSLLAKFTPMLLPAVFEIQRAPDVALAVDEINDLVDTGLSYGDVST